MATSRMEQRFREQVISDLSELKTSNKNIVEHLLKLNGEVVTTKGEVERLKISDARRSDEEERSKNSQRILWGFIGGLAIMALQHLGSLVSPFLH